MDFWELPGPADFLNRVQEDLRSGKNLLIARPRSTVSGLAEALYTKLGRQGWIVSGHAVDGTVSPMATVLAALGIEERRFNAASCVHLCRQQDCQEGRVLIIDGINGTSRKDWRGFVAEYERACIEVSEGLRTLLVLMLNEVPLEDFAKRDVALSHRVFDGVVTEIDMVIYASRQLMAREENARRRALLASSVSRVAMWDVALADRLLEGPFEQMLEPGEVLREYAVSLGWEKGDEADWSTGALASWNGCREVHSAHLAVTGRQTEIERRLWGAQAAIFLPEIERQRLRLITEAARHVCGPFETPMGRVRDVGDLEIGALNHYVRRSNASSTLKEKVSVLADARNDLAHLRRLEPSAALYGWLV